MVILLYLRWQLRRLVCRVKGHALVNIGASRLHRRCTRCEAEFHSQWSRHQGQRECVRRAKQVLLGQLPVDYEVRLSIQSAFKRLAKRIARRQLEDSQRRATNWRNHSA